MVNNLSSYFIHLKWKTSNQEDLQSKAMQLQSIEYQDKNLKSIIFNSLNLNSNDGEM